MQATRILIVDDSEDDAVLMTCNLARLGRSTSYKRVDTPEKFANALDAEAWDVVICDSVMPIDEAKRILERHHSHLPCIVVSGCVRDDKPRPAAMSAADYVAKGDPEALASALDRVLKPPARKSTPTASPLAGELAQIFCLSRDYLCIADLQGHFRHVNPAFERFIGRDQAALAGRSILEFVHPDDSERTRARLEQLQLAADTTEFDHRLRTATGDYRWVEWSAHPEPGAGAVYAVGRDVTDRKRNQQLTQAAAERLRDLYDNAPCGYHSLDANGTFVEINDEELRWLGYTREEIVGRKTLPDLLAPDSLATFHEAFGRFKSEGNVRNLEFNLRRKDGSTLPIMLSSSALFDSSGNYVMSRATTVDITARKVAEARLHASNTALERRTAQLEAANEELEAFSSSVSHDLRAPLRAIEGFSALLLEQHAGEMTEPVRASVQRISTAAHRMQQLIDDLLMLARVSRAVELSHDSVDLSAMVAEIAHELRAAEPGREVALVIAANVRATGDPRLLRIALANLLQNAWKFTRGREHAEIEFGVTTDSPEHEYFVRDNGAGFDPLHTNRLFRAFQRLHSTNQFAGTGIGLTIVHRIIRRHGGRIRAEGLTDKGATFYFSLPVPITVPEFAP